MENRIRSLLWADDDVNRRFVYTKYRLEKEGWKVVLAPNVVNAARQLRSMAFDFILFDQMYPFSDTENVPDVWGGCRLLYWLKRKRRLPQANVIPSDEVEKLKKLKPKSVNMEAPLMFLSAFDDEAVRQEILKLVPEIRMETKPMHPNQLILALRDLTRR